MLCGPIRNEPLCSSCISYVEFYSQFCAASYLLNANVLVIRVCFQCTVIWTAIYAEDYLLSWKIFGQKWLTCCSVCLLYSFRKSPFQSGTRIFIQLRLSSSQFPKKLSIAWLISRWWCWTNSTMDLNTMKKVYFSKSFFSFFSLFDIFELKGAELHLTQSGSFKGQVLSIRIFPRFGHWICVGGHTANAFIIKHVP